LTSTQTSGLIVAAGVAYLVLRRTTYHVMLATSGGEVSALNSRDKLVIDLVVVARAARATWPDAELTICADNDRCTPGNPGVTAATTAAKAVGARLAFHFLTVGGAGNALYVALGDKPNWPETVIICGVAQLLVRDRLRPRVKGDRRHRAAADQSQQGADH
jgi:hypothetical protein